MRLKDSGLTLIELLVVLAIIGILASVVLTNLRDARESAIEKRALMEFRHFSTALEMYLLDHGQVYPDDVSRGIPPGIEPYLSVGDWPNAPWQNSEYDWDNWIIDGEQVVQLSIRFCPLGSNIDDCNFPSADWAEDFDTHSAFFYCYEGPCRSHEGRPQNHPGYCVNCSCKQMQDC